jgi:hypothetical protein
MSRTEWNDYFYGHWNFSGEKQARHPAPFPEELPTRLIKMFSFVGDTVLDPFLGSGTTSVAALKLERNSVAYEINEDYSATIQERLTDRIGIFNTDARVEIVKQSPSRDSPARRIRDLPYVFTDPVPIERQVDPKTLRFGSRIDGKEAGDPRCCTAKKVLSPSEQKFMSLGAEQSAGS